MCGFREKCRKLKKCHEKKITMNYLCFAKLFPKFWELSKIYERNLEKKRVNLVKNYWRQI